MVVEESASIAAAIDNATANATCHPEFREDDEKYI